MKLTINVTQEDIDNGECGNAGKCAIALAIRDIFPNALVGAYVITFNIEDVEKFKKENKIERLLFKLGCEQGLAIQTPNIAQSFIFDFDAKRRVEPISFDIEVPERYINSVNIDEIKEILKDHPNLVLHE